MPQPTSTLLWPLRLIVVLSLALPALAFLYVSWEDRQAIANQTSERIERALDVLQEQTLKSFQTVERSIAEINEVLRGLSDDEVRLKEAELHLRFRRTQQALPQMESIWAFDKDGHPLVSSTILPVPQTLNNSDRSYFAAQKNNDRGIFISEVVRARVGNARFFVVSGRRTPDAAGEFNGVIGVTMKPEHFSDFYSKLATGRDSFGLVRDDGLLLARFPQGEIANAPAPAAAIDAIRQDPTAGRFTLASPVDALERLIGYRRVSGLPVYAMAGIETRAMRDMFWRNALTRLSLGLPVTLVVFGLALQALRRTQRFQEETMRRQAAEVALKQSQRLEAVGQLTGGVAHDFNNLLMIVGGNVQRIRRLAGDERVRRYVEAIELAVSRGSSLTRQLLSFARRQTHEAKVIDLHDRLPDLREMLQSSLRGDIAVEISVADKLWPTKIDVSELELALLNLAVNARDAMSSGGRLTISARNITFREGNPHNLEGDFVELSVADTGTGIPPEILDRVFEPFFTTKEVGKGTGLGLSQVYGFAKQAGGTATVTSTIGAGTTVTLYLPRASGPAEPALKESDQRIINAVRHAGSVLVVEDNPDVAEVTCGLLEDLGYQVSVVPDVSSALGFLRTKSINIDIVLTDIVMPGSANGIDLARSLRRDFDRTLAVVLASGYSDQAQKAADEGFVMLRKPYDSSALQDAIDEARRQTVRAKVS